MLIWGACIVRLVEGMYGEGMDLRLVCFVVC